jgi:hypothetical protein
MENVSTNRGQLAWVCPLEQLGLGQYQDSTHAERIVLTAVRDLG